MYRNVYFNPNSSRIFYVGRTSFNTKNEANSGESEGTKINTISVGSGLSEGLHTIVFDGEKVVIQ